MIIGKKTIGPGRPCFIIAEISGNHHQHYDEAVALVRAARESGADAVKLQTYTPDTITMNSRKEWFMVAGTDNPDIWKGKSLYELYQTAYTPWDWQPKLKAYADELGIPLFSSPFDETAVDLLESMDVPAYKIASYEVNHIPLLKRVAQTGKPVIMSVGFADLPDIELALKTLRDNGANKIAILHCVTSYAEGARLEDIHLATIADIRRRLHVISGFSDNNGGIEIPLMAVQAGASIVEKHFILDRRSGGPDARFSIEPSELSEFVQSVRAFERTKTSSVDAARFRVALRQPHYGPNNEAEKYNQRFRRSIFVTQNIKRGEVFTPKNIRVIRPAFGLHSKHWEEVLGKTAAQDIEAGTPLALKYIA